MSLSGLTSSVVLVLGCKWSGKNEIKLDYSKDKTETIDRDSEVDRALVLYAANQNLSLIPLKVP